MCMKLQGAKGHAPPHRRRDSWGEREWTPRVLRLLIRPLRHAWRCFACAGVRSRRDEPKSVRSFCQRAQGVAILAHEVATRLELFFHVGVIRGDAKTVGRGGESQRVALFDLEHGKRLLGQDEANRIADLGQLDLEMHGFSPFQRMLEREVITNVKLRQAYSGATVTLMP